MLFGLSVLRHATGDQLSIAMQMVEASKQMTRAEIQEMLAR